jgi:hypothetical protein
MKTHIEGWDITDGWDGITEGDITNEVANNWVRVG